MEQENKIERDKAKKERNEQVRNLVAFVRKRDKRVVVYRKKLEEKAEENKLKTKEFQKKQREERKKLFEVASNTSGFGMSEMEDELKQLEGQYSDSEFYSSEDEDMLDEDVDDDIDEDHEEYLEDELYCVACDKTFKSRGARENHETSKKHIDNFSKLVEEMRDEENKDQTGEGVNKERGCVNDIIASVDLDRLSEGVEGSDSEDELEVKPNKKKKKKKGGGNKKLPVETLAVEEVSDVENDFLKPQSDDDLDTNRKKSKGKSKKKSKAKCNNQEISKENEDPSKENGDISKEILVAENGTAFDATDSSDKVLLSKSADKIADDDESDDEITNKKSLKKGKNKKKGKQLKDLEEESETNLQRGDLNCAQCKQTFPSKNKLYNHLKSTGHAVYLPKSGSDNISSKSKKKKDKVK